VAANNTRSGMDEITNILDNVDISGLPLSSNFSTTAKYERARRGRLPREQCFLKPTDLLPREDPFRRKRALLGPGAAESRRGDWFYQLDIDPLDEATNPRLLSYFVTDMGKMKSRAETKLTWRNQRRLTKAVRRAKMMGVMPILHKRVTLYH
jgi:small subunit ribosomal protein S18